MHICLPWSSIPFFLSLPLTSSWTRIQQPTHCNQSMPRPHCTGNITTPSLLTIQSATIHITNSFEIIPLIVLFYYGDNCFYTDHFWFARLCVGFYTQSQSEWKYNLQTGRVFTRSGHDKPTATFRHKL